ncbi:MAG: sensor histidine kinase [Herbinix sp.]|jgi:signal transduction histidine kinase|nr:sensor histidine kinase [Herbinix sp.]
MLYLCISLFLIVVILSARLYFIRKAIATTSTQMEEIELHPELNRQLKAFTTDSKVEGLLKKINDIYDARQEERIVYQRRETQIRREIENISHDLRTPLTSILGYVDLIQDEETTETERVEYLSIIYKRAKILQGFIQDFYEISRIEGDNYPFLLDSIPVQSTLREAVVTYYHEFEKNNIQVTVELEETQSFLIADKIQFNRILNNLIQNALKYAQRQFIIKQITLEGYCILQFMNDKNTMTEEELNVIFERFYTRDQSRNNQSTGLGLTITKVLVEKMKGQIEAKIEKDLFIIELRWFVP